ncbi:MAG: inovirus-type Gp2 protein, partial [Gammaproteobacteria bacterium]|nr:inovirus-type Gp2 protein [Gammaproteobacteria bacterium]
MNNKHYITYKEPCQVTQDVEVEVYADMVKIKREMQYMQKGGNTRKECKGFSDDSRRRLMQKMSMWNLNGLSLLFVTLTYPGIYTEDWEVWKRDVDTFIKRLERKYEVTVGCLWRIEFQKRGAPHFHMILATNKECKSIVVFRAQIQQMWADIVRDGYLMSGGKIEQYEQHYNKHLKAGTGVEEVKGRKQLMSYVSKYVAKNTNIKAPDNFGRNWGFRDMNGKLDFSPVETVVLNNKQGNELKRMIKHWLKSRGQGRYSRKLDHMCSYTVFGLGVDSSSRNAIYRMLSATVRGLLAPHIFPSRSTGRFIDRIAVGCYGDKWRIKEETRVKT